MHVSKCDWMKRTIFFVASQCFGKIHFRCALNMWQMLCMSSSYTHKMRDEVLHFIAIKRATKRTERAKTATAQRQIMCLLYFVLIIADVACCRNVKELEELLSLRRIESHYGFCHICVACRFRCVFVVSSIHQCVFNANILFMYIKMDKNNMKLCRIQRWITHCTYDDDGSFGRLFAYLFIAINLGSVTFSTLRPSNHSNIFEMPDKRHVHPKVQRRMRKTNMRYEWKRKLVFSFNNVPLLCVSS